jgi:hypothetical protein
LGRRPPATKDRFVPLSQAALAVLAVLGRFWTIQIVDG